MIFAGIASIPERVESLRRTVASLIDQVDMLGVYLNGYEDVPAFLDDPRIATAQAGNRGDAGKFFWAGGSGDFYLACDDDLAYPPDYVQTIIAGIERYGRSAIVGYGGKLFRAGRPQTKYAALGAVAHDRFVHLLLTCAIGYHESALHVRPEDFQHPNMADVWLALLAQRQEVPMVLITHADELVHTQHERTIWDESRKRTGSFMDTRALQEKLIAETSWRVHEVAVAA